ncbi:MAG: hypothetical protein ACI8X5_000120 [Planctomycetota bacterium]
MPEESEKHLAVALARHHPDCYEARTGSYRWLRRELPDEKSLLQARAGYVAGFFGSPEQLMQSGKTISGSTKLSNHMRDLYDLKRVRAAICGFPLLPLKR